MSLQAAITLTAGLIGIVLFIGSFEFLLIARNKLFSQVWTFENLNSELTTQLPFPKWLTRIIFSDRNFQFLAALQMCFTIIMLYKVSLWIVVALLFVHLLICIRFRGTFNGGSDMMTVVVLTGLIISLINPNWQKAGIIYICVHALFSYFKAGWVKLKSADWRQGVALKSFLSRSSFAMTKKVSHHLDNRKTLNLILCWFVIIVELLAALLPVFPKLKIAYLIGAVTFHLIVYFAFGLNRFFWAWLASWPATFYCLANI